MSLSLVHIHLTTILHAGARMAHHRVYMVYALLCASKRFSGFDIQPIVDKHLALVWKNIIGTPAAI